jgi:hypothetical protein
MGLPQYARTSKARALNGLDRRTVSFVSCRQYSTFGVDSLNTTPPIEAIKWLGSFDSIARLSNIPLSLSFLPSTRISKPHLHCHGTFYNLPQQTPLRASLPLTSQGQYRPGSTHHGETIYTVFLNVAANALFSKGNAATRSNNPAATSSSSHVGRLWEIRPPSIIESDIGDDGAD